MKKRTFDKGFDKTLKDMPSEGEIAYYTTLLFTEVVDRLYIEFPNILKVEYSIKVIKNPPDGMLHIGIRAIGVYYAEDISF